MIPKPAPPSGVSKAPHWHPEAPWSPIALWPCPQSGLCAGEAGAAGEGWLCPDRQRRQQQRLEPPARSASRSLNPARGRRRCRSAGDFPAAWESRSAVSLCPGQRQLAPACAPRGQGSAGWLWGWWHGRSHGARPASGGTGGVPPSLASGSPKLHLLRPSGWEWGGGGRLGCAEEAGPKPYPDGALHHPSVLTGTRGLQGWWDPPQGNASGVVPRVDKPQARSLHRCQRGMGWWKGRGRCWWLHSISRARILGFPLNLQLPESGDSVRLN